MAKVYRSGKRTDTKTREPQGHWFRELFKQQQSKKRTPETCLCCGKEGHKNADCKFKSATSSNCGKVGHLRVVCRNTNTHEIEKDADEPSPEVTVEAVWCMAVRDIVEDGHCDCTEKHDVSSEHRDESKLTEVPVHPDESKFRKIITNFETGPNSEKWSRRSRWVNRIENEDRNQDMSEFVQKELTDQTARKTQRVRNELADGSTIRTRKN